MKVSSKLIQWADLVFVMEKRHKERLLNQFRDELNDRELIVLDIPDDYGYMDEELIDILTVSVSTYFNDEQ
ncbi:hypothetical protein GCM10028807_06410 [Spirosoma daeguense]